MVEQAEPAEIASPMFLATPPATDKRVCILVLGMHRSGTSAVTRTMGLLGGALPQHPLGVNVTNETGHWEPEQLIQLHDRMLAEAGSRWDDWRAIDLSNLLNPSRLATYRSEITQILQREFGNAQLVVLKDPRISRFVPFYTEILESLNFDVRYVLVQRNPLDVIASLITRDGTSPAFCSLIWLRHQLEAERHTRQAPRVVISYEALLDDWRGETSRIGRTLSLKWPRRPEDARAEIEGYLSQSHRHHRQGSDLTEGPQLARWVKDAYAAFKALERSDLDAKAIASLVQIRAEFDAVEPVIGDAFFAELDARQAVFFAELGRRQVTFETALLKSEELLSSQVAEHHDTETGLKRQLERLDKKFERLVGVKKRLKDQIAERTGEVDAAAADTRRVADELANAKQYLTAMEQTVSWRITHPLRAARSRMTWANMSALAYYWHALPTSLRRDGLAATLRKIVTVAKRSATGPRSLRPSTKPAALYPAEVSFPANELLNLAVLLIAELSIPQCEKYRVTQKREMLERLGARVSVIDWHETERARSALQTHSIAIFYRVPGFPDAINLIGEAKRLSVHTFWEVDDLIFDATGYLANRNIARLDADQRRAVLAGVPLYRRALLACDEVIASTDCLLAEMEATGARQGYVVENALDRETLRAASAIRRALKSGPVRGSTNERKAIVYGSGSNTHDADFLTASDALLKVLQQRPEVTLRIVGPLSLPRAFASFASQIERIPMTDFKSYLSLLAESDIAIAPLEDSRFNDAKSNIKYLEASIVCVPTVCSPRAAFRDVVDHGKTGYLAETPDDWVQSLTELLDSPKLRRNMGRSAAASVLARYRPGTIARKELAPIVERFARPDKGRPRLLLANIFYKPSSFGGATIVAEELARGLSADFDVYVFTSWQNDRAPPYGLVRYDANGVTVFAVKLPDLGDHLTVELENPKIREVFEEVLDAVQPDVTHFHSIQGLGTSIVDAVRDRSIPYVITLHDAWWICERQFMIKADDKYCGVTSVGPAACASCVGNVAFNRHRDRLLREALGNASALLSPSAFFKNLHVNSGLSADKIIVSQNGVRLPTSRRRSDRSGKLRFAYVGGDTPIKGYSILKEAFEAIGSSNYELIIVDNTVTLGFRSINGRGWNIKGNLRVEPAYSQDSIDEFFSGVDVLVFPTQWKESFGLTVREALARDIWVIATDAGGVAEAITPGVNGTIIPLNAKSSALKAAIEELILDADRFAHWENPHRDRIRSFQQHVDETRSILTSVIEGSHQKLDA